MNDEDAAHTNFPRCNLVRCRREANKLYWAPWNPLSNYTVAARVEPLADEFELDDYSGQSDDIPWKSNSTRLPGPLNNDEETNPSIEDNFARKRATMPHVSLKPSRRPSLCEWRKGSDKPRANLVSGRFSKDDTTPAHSILARLCSMPNVRKQEDSEGSSITRHSIDATPWCNDTYLRSSPVYRRQRSLHFYGEYPDDSSPYMPVLDDDDEEFDIPQKHCIAKPRRWIALLQKRFSRRVKVFEFDDRIGIFLIDNYY